MNTDKFLDLNAKSKDFFEGYVPLKPVTYCVVIIYTNGYSKEVYGIENPWQFIAGVKKNIKVESAYIKT